MKIDKIIPNTVHKAPGFHPTLIGLIMDNSISGRQSVK